MNLRIQIIRPESDVRAVLQGDGWKVEPEGPDGIRASHPGVPNEQQARERLWRLGLLTSGSVRIDFPMQSGGQ